MRDNHNSDHLTPVERILSKPWDELWECAWRDILFQEGDWDLALDNLDISGIAGDVFEENNGNNTRDFAFDSKDPFEQAFQRSMKRLKLDKDLEDLESAAEGLMALMSNSNSSNGQDQQAVPGRSPRAIYNAQTQARTIARDTPPAPPGTNTETHRVWTSRDHHAQNLKSSGQDISDSL